MSCKLISSLKNFLLFSAITTSSAAVVGDSLIDSGEISGDESENTDFLSSVGLLSSKVHDFDGKEELGKRIKDLSESILNKEDVKEAIKELLRWIPKDRLEEILNSQETNLENALEGVDWRLNFASNTSYEVRNDVSDEEVKKFWDKFKLEEEESDLQSKLEKEEPKGFISNLISGYSKPVGSFFYEGVSNVKDYFFSSDASSILPVSPESTPSTIHNVRAEKQVDEVVVKTLAKAPKIEKVVHQKPIPVGARAGTIKPIILPSNPPKIPVFKEPVPQLVKHDPEKHLIRYSSLWFPNGHAGSSLSYFGQSGIETSLKQARDGLKKQLATQTVKKPKVLRNKNFDFSVYKDAVFEEVIKIITTKNKEKMKEILGLISEGKLVEILESDESDLKSVLEKNWSLEFLFDDLENSEIRRVSDSEVEKFWEKFKLPDELKNMGEIYYLQ